MKFSYKFSNLLSTIYRKGDLLFTPDGSSVISPAGNRITICDLKNNKSLTLPVESRFNYSTIDISPDGRILVAINEDGEAHIISLMYKMILYKYRFKGHPKKIKFSPDGKHFAVCKGGSAFIFNAPGLQMEDYNPFIMEHSFHGATADTTCVSWSFDSKLLSVGSKDSIIRIYGLQKWTNFRFRYIALAGHTNAIVACFFEKKNYNVYTISKNGRVIVWECTIEPDDLIEWEPPLKKEKVEDSDSEDDIDVKKIEKAEKQKINDEYELLEADNSQDDVEEDVAENKNIQVKKLGYRKLGCYYVADDIHKQHKSAKITAAAYHQDIRILVIGYNIGAFYLYEMPHTNMLHSLSIFQQHISSIALNPTGDWIALGCPYAGQLLVWEWQSETYIMNQQGHRTNINSLAYSLDGLYIVTGGDDGKVKIWDTQSGFCTVTFHEHTSSISAVIFSHDRKFIVSASLDGTIRANDLMRYHNFRTFISPRPVQFSCLALDASDEFLTAGGQDFFDIYLWSMKSGILLEILSSHEGPVVSLAFNPNFSSTEMVSVSWDKTLKIWAALENSSAHETILLTADALCVTYRPDGKEIAVATLDGQISFFDCRTARQTGFIEGRTDLGAGRSKTDLITAKKNLETKAFTSLCYSPDGLFILAGGHSKNICIYNVQESVLFKKFEITQNRSLDGVDDIVSRKFITEFGNKALIEQRDNKKIALQLPGVRKGDMAKRNFKLEVRVFCLQFSSTGQAWAASTTEGLLIYSSDNVSVFDPFELELGITPDVVIKTLKQCDYVKALMMALKLNERPLIQQVIETIPYNIIELTIMNMLDVYVEKLLSFIASELESNNHIHFYYIWIQIILLKHGSRMNSKLQMTLATLDKNIKKKYNNLNKTCTYIQHMTNYVLSMGELINENSNKDNESDTEMELIKMLSGNE